MRKVTVLLCALIMLLLTACGTAKNDEPEILDSGLNFGGRKRNDTA